MGHGAGALGDSAISVALFVILLDAEVSPVQQFVCIDSTYESGTR